jgi:hypothetical protein
LCLVVLTAQFAKKRGGTKTTRRRCRYII